MFFQLKVRLNIHYFPSNGFYILRSHFKFTYSVAFSEKLWQRDILGKPEIDDVISQGLSLVPRVGHFLNSFPFTAFRVYSIHSSEPMNRIWQGIITENHLIDLKYFFIFGVTSHFSDFVITVSVTCYAILMYESFIVEARQ